VNELQQVVLSDVPFHPGHRGSRAGFQYNTSFVHRLAVAERPLRAARRLRLPRHGPGAAAPRAQVVTSPEFPSDEIRTAPGRVLPATLWAAVTLNFFLPRMMPGNPAVAMMGKFRGKISGPGTAALETIFGVNSGQSLPAQYVHYLGDIFTGNFGTSLFYFPSPVSQVVGTAIFWTLGLVGVTVILAFALGTGSASLSALAARRAHRQHRAPLLVIASAIPYFWVGMMFILIFGLKLQWLPWSGGMNLTDTPALTPSFHRRRPSSTRCCQASRC